MSFFPVARKSIGAWWHGQESAKPAQKRPPQAQAKDSDDEDKWSKIEAFIETLSDETPNPLGRMRLVSFNGLRERIGDKWGKLQGKIELLGEKMLKDGSAEGDRYLNIGNAQFLVFYADASPEEIKLCCWAIMERIQEKLFGVDGKLLGASERLAPDPPAQIEQDATPAEDEGILRFFRREGESLGRESFLASAQKAIDSILAAALEAKTPAETRAVKARLTRLSGDVHVITRALIRTEENARPVEDPKSQSTARGGLSELIELKDDAAKLAAILDPVPDRAQAIDTNDLIILRKARAERDASKAAEIAIPHLETGFQPPNVFEYVPVLRPLRSGDRIYQSIFRLDCRGLDETTACDRAKIDMLLLEHAVNFLADRKVATNSLLMVPVHMDTLLEPSFQERYSALLGAAGWIKRLIVIEVLGSRGSESSASAISHALDRLDEDLLAVFVILPYENLGDLQQIAIECKRAGVHAVGVDVVPLQEAAMESVLRQIASVCQQWSLGSYVSGVSGTAISEKAAAAGISYTCEANIRSDLRMRA